MDLRLSDADRERALSELGKHYRVGRLTPDEFDERTRLVLQAKTTGQLAGLFDDLPDSGQDRRRTFLRIVLAVAIAVGTVAVLRRIMPRVFVAVAVIIVLIVMFCTHRYHSSHGINPLELIPVALVVLLRRRRPGGHDRSGMPR
jgi:hypothetical protein